MSVVVAPEKNGVGAFPPDGELPYVPPGIAEDAIVERVWSARVEMDDHSIGGDAVGRDAEADVFAPAIIRGDPERLPFDRDVCLRRRKDADKEQDREKQHRFFLRSECMPAPELTGGTARMRNNAPSPGVSGRQGVRNIRQNCRKSVRFDPFCSGAVPEMGRKEGMCARVPGGGKWQH
jgi:hypothetical protein